MSYDIEGWQNNEGSGTGWLDEVMGASEEAKNYVPPGYENGAWDTTEHYSYEPGYSNAA